MTRTLVTNFAVRGLEYLFTPAGLPLVEKSEGRRTTSVLIRGAAGTGKSTLALAIAQAVAHTSAGFVLYLVTEASTSDVEYKAQLLGLTHPIKRFHPAETFEPGAVAVAHLRIERPDLPGGTTNESDSDAIVTAWNLLEACGPDRPTPVRAVVIDGLGLFEGPNRSSLDREDFIGFLQSVEDRGITPIVVEEVGAGSSELLTFPIDVVFSLVLATNPDDNRLTRQLIVSKSRYATSTAGPHDAVVENGVPVLWPFTPDLSLGPVRPSPGFFMPYVLSAQQAQGRGQPSVPPSIIAINRGALILSLYDTGSLRVLRATALPHSTVAVACGPTITVAKPNAPSRSFPASHGPAALLWALHEAVSSGLFNAVIFTGLEYLLARSRFAAFVPELIDRLTRSGILVLIHGTSGGLKPLDDLADFTGPLGHYRSNDVVKISVRQFRAVPVWTRALPGIDRPSGGAGLDDRAGLLLDAEAKISLGEYSQARDLLQRVPHGPDPQSHRFVLDAAFLLDRIGMTRTARAKLQPINSDDPLILLSLAWMLLELGDEVAASVKALDAIDRDQVTEDARALWFALRTRFTTAQMMGSNPSELQGRFLAEAICLRGSPEAADEVLAMAVGHPSLHPGHLERLRADVRLYSDRKDLHAEARTRYEALLQQEAGLSTLARADILYNLGWIHEQAGEPDASIRRYREALQENPLLELAVERLSAAGVGLAPDK